METPVLQIKKFKVSEIVDAIEKNGLEHLRGSWLSTFNGKINGGCVLGQAAFNMGVFGADQSFMTKAQNNLMNSGTRNFGLAEQLNKFNNTSRYRVDKSGDAVLPRCGDAIIHWNDAEYMNRMGYRLKTYEAVVKMVKAVLYKHMDKTVELLVVDYSEWTPPTFPVPNAPVQS